MMQQPGPIHRQGGEVAPLASRGLASSSLCLCARSTRGFLFLLMALAGWRTLRSPFSSYSATTRLMMVHQDQALHDVMTGGDLHYYSPTLYNAGSNDDDTNNKEKYKKEDFPWPTIHIVMSRFMQRQPNLTALGHARITLFEAFCLPTMQHQTSQQFLWIMKTDPNLDPGILKKMVQLLQPFPNAYLVGSNGDSLHWRDGSQGRDLASHRVYTGNRTLLEAAMALETQLPVLETRLDADDGLHVQYIETIQKVASEQVFLPPPLPEGEKEQEPLPQSRLKWKHWCADRNVNWHSSIIAATARSSSSSSNNNNSNKNMSSSPSMLYGKIVGPVHDKWCITPGLTTAYAIGTTLEQVKNNKHHLLRKMFQSTPLSPEQSCGLPDSSQCVDILKDLHPFEAIRARSPTSAGMKDILGGPGVKKEDKVVDEAMWDNLNTYFRIQREKVQFAQEYFMQNLVEIAKDNLVGQCTPGHSCKETSKMQLQEIIAAHSG